MSFAHSASSSVGAATRSVLRPTAARTSVRSGFAVSAQAESSTQARNYASAAALADEPSTSYSSAPPSGSSRRSQQSSSASASSSSSSLPPASTSIPVLTPDRAQSYLSDLLHLSPAQAFPPPLAMQTLTHKSYKYAHLVKPAGSSFRSRLLGQDQPGSAAAGAHSEEGGAAAAQDFLEASMQPHNARLSFIGRRALTTYFALFVHDAVRTSRALRETALLELKDGLDHKISAMRDSRNLGRTVGDRWGVGDVMRWDRNQNSLPSSAAKIKGLTVEAIFGALYSLHGGPAAQRAFHLHILPLLSWQLRDPALQDRAESLRKDVHSQLGGRVLNP